MASNDATLKLIHSVDEMLKGTKLCAKCLKHPPNNRLVTRWVGTGEFEERPWWKFWQKPVEKTDLHWYCPHCDEEWTERREFLGPAGTVYPMDEQRAADGCPDEAHVA